MFASAANFNADISSWDTSSAGTGTAYFEQHSFISFLI